MQVQKINENFNIKNQPSFGMKVSKVGRQIDRVLEQKGLCPQDVKCLRARLGDYFSSSDMDKRLIGSGFHGNVFAIDDKYVFKLKFGESPNIEHGKFVMPGKGGISLSGLKTYFGGVLMSLGNVQIMRNVSTDNRHMPAGIPRRMLVKFNNEDLKAYYNNIYLPTFANLPQRSFDRLAKDFAYLNKQSRFYYGLQFDTNNPNNIVLVGTSTLRIVDDINEVMEEAPNRVCGLLDMFLKKANTMMLAPKSDENRGLRLELFKKIILAGEKYELPLTSARDYDRNVWKMVCDFGNGGWQIPLDLHWIRMHEKNKTARLAKVCDYLSEKVSREGT